MPDGKRCYLVNSEPILKKTSSDLRLWSEPQSQVCKTMHTEAPALRLLKNLNFWHILQSQRVYDFFLNALADLPETFSVGALGLQNIPKKWTFLGEFNKKFR